MSNAIFKGAVTLFLISAITLATIPLLNNVNPMPYTAYAAEKNCVRITVAEELSSLNPLVGNSLVDWFIFNLIYDKLAIYGPDLKPLPWLAKNWEVSPDGTTWTIHLVCNATWQDGVPFTAEDVVFTINYIKEHKVGLWLDEVADIDTVKALDKCTVVLKMKKPIAFIDTYVLPRLPILPKHIWEKIEEPIKYPNEHPVGNGPFILKEYKPGEYLYFEANPNYWRGKPHIDCIIAKIGLTSDQAFLELKKGSLDIMVLPYEYVKEAEKDPNIKVVITDDIYFDYIVFNTKKYPFSLKEFRHALAYAINRQELVNRVLLGYGEVAHSVIPPAYKFWYNPNVVKYEYNPEKAKKILDKLGIVDKDGDGWRDLPNGTHFEIEVLTLSTWPPYVRMADLLKKYFEDVGLKTKITAVEWGEESKRLHDRNYMIAIWGYTVAPEPSQFLSLFTNNPPPYWSMGEWQNDTYNKFFEEQKHIMSLEERRKIIWKLQEILAEELPILPIWVDYVVEGYRIDRFTGWIPMPMGILGIYNKLTWLSVRPIQQVPITKTVVETVTQKVVTTVVTTTTSIVKGTETIIKTMVSTITTTVPRTITVTTTTPVSASPSPTVTTAAAGGMGAAVIAGVVIAVIVVIIIALLLRRR